MSTKFGASAAQRVRQMGVSLLISANDWIPLLLYSARTSAQGNPRWATRVLPFEMRPPLQTYPHHAHLLGLLPPGAMEWLVRSYYLNISAVNIDPSTAFDLKGHPSRHMHLDYNPYVGPYSCPEKGLFTRTEWTDDWPKRPREILDRVYSALRAGSYLQIHLNELFLRGSASWRKAHQRHQTLIYGYDNASDTFYCAGYDKIGEYNRMLLPRRLLLPALLSRGGCDRSEHFAKNYIAELRPEAPKTRALPMAWLRQQLVDFRNSRDSGHNQPDGIYGRSVLRYLQLYFWSCAEQNLAPDLKITRFLWEMAKGMEARLRTVVHEGFSWMEHYIGTASELEKHTNRLRLRTHAIWVESESKTVDWGFLREYEEVLARQEQYYDELAAGFEMLDLEGADSPRET